MLFGPFLGTYLRISQKAFFNFSCFDSFGFLGFDSELENEFFFHITASLNATSHLISIA